MVDPTVIADGLETLDADLTAITSMTTSVTNDLSAWQVSNGCTGFACFLHNTCTFGFTLVEPARY
jgi:hypothetical protein